MLGLVGLAALGFEIPVVRQIVGFIFLTFVPGLLILRILRLHRLGAIETLLYSVGLSIAFVMFLGFFINTFYPVLGISKLISIYPVIITITVIVLILCAIAYKRESSEKESPLPNSPIQWSGLLSPPVLFLFLLPVLSAVGTFLVYFHYGNVPLLVLLSLIALTAVLVAYGKFIPTKLYPLAIMAISIALLWHVTLLTFYLPGSDMYREYFRLESILGNSIWNPAIGSNLNAMLSIVMLTPIYSLVLSLDTVWVIKLFLPFFFCLVPVALFQAYRKQTNDKVAFLAAFFFMSMPVFFGLMPGIRQPIAELFLALSILLFLDREMNAAKRAALLIIFGLSLVVSHYGTSYVYMLYLLMALPLLLLWRSSTVSEAWTNVVTRLGKFRHIQNITPQSSKPASRSLSGSTLTTNYVVLFIVFCLAWYMYVSSGSPFYSLVRIGDHIYPSIFTQFFSVGRDPHVMQALGLAPMRSIEIEWSIARIFQYITQFLIVAGVVDLILNHRKTKFYPEYTAMTLVSAVIVGFCIVLPYFAKTIGMMRMYHITLFFLAPFCILGGRAVFYWLYWLVKLFSRHSLSSLATSTYIKIVVIGVLLPYFLFGTGFIFELTGATATSPPLSFYKTDWGFFTKAEMHASRWLAKMPDDNKIYCDGTSAELLYYGRASEFKRWGLRSDIKMEEDSYIFLRRWNVIAGEVLVSRGYEGQFITYEDLDKIEVLKSSRVGKIYDSKEAQILWYSK